MSDFYNSYMLYAFASKRLVLVSCDFGEKEANEADLSVRGMAAGSTHHTPDYRRGQRSTRR